jgi:hypothetical protein
MQLGRPLTLTGLLLVTLGAAALTFAAPPRERVSKLDST